MKAGKPDQTLARLSLLEEIILLTLLHEQELYGLQIIEAVKEASEGKFQIGVGSLYPALHKLEKKGYVTSRWGDERPEERGGARRRYYTISGLGKRALEEIHQLRANIAVWQPA